MTLIWTNPAPPNTDIRYDHTIAVVATEDQFAKEWRITIEWKSWKDYGGYCVDDSLFGYVGSGNDLDDAKAIADRHIARIRDHLNILVTSDTSNEPPKTDPVAADVSAERAALVDVILDAMLGRYPGRGMARAVADALIAAGWRKVK